MATLIILLATWLWGISYDLSNFLYGSKDVQHCIQPPTLATPSNTPTLWWGGVWGGYRAGLTMLAVHRSILSEPPGIITLDVTEPT